MRFYLFLSLLFFCFCGVSLTETQNHGFKMELIHPTSSRSPFYNSKEAQIQRVSSVINHSINRAHYLNHVLSFSRNDMPKPTIIAHDYMGPYYVMSYSIGTPPFQLYGAMDTGSDGIWFQCKPCKPCLNQTSPMFNPSKSSTYKNIHCSSPTCKRFENSHCSSNHKRKCEYKVSYLSKSMSQGDVGIDTLTLNSNDGSPISFSRIVMGCGHKNSLKTEGGNTSGIIGFGRGPLSLISQLSSSINGKFSYCLVPLFSNANSSSRLNFGDTAVVSGSEVVSTPLVGNTGYFTNLEAFSVEDHIIKFNDSSLIPDKEGNTIIDSGSTLTILPEDVYSQLESTVASMIKLKRVKDPNQQLSLCYKSTLKTDKVPIITAHFRGANVTLNAVNTFIEINHEVMCFAFSSSIVPFAIYGNVAQQNFLVGFDTLNNIISFKPKDCTKQ